MLADLAGDHPRLRCFPDHSAAIAHVAIRGAAGNLHKSDAAHSLPLLATSAKSQIALGVLGTSLHGCPLHNVHHAAADLPRPAGRPQGAGDARHHGAAREAGIHGLGLRPPLHWGGMGNRALVSAWFRQLARIKL